MRPKECFGLPEQMLIDCDPERIATGVQRVLDGCGADMGCERSMLTSILKPNADPLQTAWTIGDRVLLQKVRRVPCHVFLPVYPQIRPTLYLGIS